MFRHVVMFRWNDDVDPAHVAAVGAELDALPPQIPEIAVYRHGPDAGVNEGNFDYVVVADFASVDDYLVYRDHPVHQSMIQRMIAGRVAQRAAVQYVTGD
ncbi:MAG: Dabb family protein [Ilumatobacteraceae bacterium]